MAESTAKLFDSMEILVVWFGAINGTTGSVKNSVGIRTASRGIDEFEIAVLEASLRKPVFE
jgi:hypothetical protein